MVSVSENGNDYTEYPMLEEQTRGTVYSSRPTTSQVLQGNITPSVDLNFDVLAEVADDD